MYSLAVPANIGLSLLPAAVSESCRKPHVLSVSGSDSGGGAGMQADIKACGALGVYCSAAITAITAQNTTGVQGIQVTPENIFAMQLQSVLSDMEVDVVKTGMLPTVQIIDILRSQLESYPVKGLSHCMQAIEMHIFVHIILCFSAFSENTFQRLRSGLVVDPVLIASSGDCLTSHEVADMLCKRLLPLADIVTPNLTEAAVLSGKSRVCTLLDMQEAAKIIKDFGPRYVLVKGGHLQDISEANVDLLYDGETFYDFHGTRVETLNTHGTGCTLASCIAAEMAKGVQIPEAVKAAKGYIQAALEHSKNMKIGKGPHGPLNHFFAFPEYSKIRRHHLFKASDLRLYAVTDSGMNKRWQRSTAEAVRSAIEGGATIVQLREKEAESSDFFKEAVACIEVARKSGVPLVINDRLDIAMACGADGVHLGQSDLPVREARMLLGLDKIIGVSCKTVEQVQKAYEDGANYVGCGGVYPTNTKRNNRTIGLEGLYAICSASPLPVVAIGGINEFNAEEVLRDRPSTLHGIAVVSALFDKPVVCKATQVLAGKISEFFHR
ncbi:hypothetical protein KP509_35G010200 [Ceratopteris richardii]|uniref:thiamine phosphate synthase n=2 Tax=Ceratopteris richardii TaxID=49495 RepID=A0A8T2QEM3_CERRI|nr:hypothetical protein KP509_35G010200 [Ceratopteris richardii]